MNASIVVAICATVIAVLSLAVSVYEAWATRRHDRISVRPHLALQASLRQGRAGPQLIKRRPRPGGDHQDRPNA